MIISGRATIKRTCDKCGAQRDARPGVFRVIAGRWICSWHDTYIAPEQLDKAPIKTFTVRPIKGARPFQPRDTHEVAETELFKFLIANYSADYVDVTGGAGAQVSSSDFATGVRGAAWTGIYLYELINEAKRPHKTIAQAKTTLAAVADFLLSRMVGGPHVTGAYDNTSVQWGAFDAGGATSGDGVFWVRDSGAAGLALLRAYQVHGTASYLAAARACAWFVRSAQSGGRMATGYSSSDAAGSSRIHHGAFTGRFQVASGVLTADHYYRPGDLIALEFLDAFLDEVGDETIGSSGVAGDFSITREALVSTAIAEAKAFWTAGTYDVTAGEVVNGFSTAAPFEAFNAYPSAGKYDKTGSGSWEYQDGDQSTGTLLTALEWAVGVRALRALDGDSATVTGLFDWLVGFSSNDDYELPATPTNRGSGYSDAVKWAGIAGTYDATLALSTLLLVRESSEDATKNGSSLYDLAAVGALAGLWAARKTTRLDTLKAALGEPRRRSEHAGNYLYLGPLGRCGLSYQPYSDASLNRRQIVQYAAMGGLMFRASPQAFLGRGVAA